MDQEYDYNPFGVVLFWMVFVMGLASMGFLVYGIIIEDNTIATIAAVTAVLGVPGLGSILILSREKKND